MEKHTLSKTTLPGLRKILLLSLIAMVAGIGVVECYRALISHDASDCVVASQKQGVFSTHTNSRGHKTYLFNGSAMACKYGYGASCPQNTALESEHGRMVQVSWASCQGMVGEKHVVLAITSADGKQVFYSPAQLSQWAKDSSTISNYLLFPASLLGLLALTSWAVFVAVRPRAKRS